ncbi:MAG: class I SAM-dependent methyltransferase [Candidatus Cloacimonetes bacterium]|nr:class I SAM-dependent methyltransferase [Candidatus Cloacimonadota bacterium]
MNSIKNRHQKAFEKFQKQKKNINRLWNIEEQTANLLYLMIKVKSPKNILEIGTSNGYSTFWLSLAAANSKAIVHTLEIDKQRFELAKDNLQDRKNIELHLGLAEEIIPKLRQKFDFVFIDANKPDYIVYLKLLEDKLENNALIIADNIFSHQESVKEYLDFIRGNPLFETMTLEIDSGLEISVFDDKLRT